jgi:hypothetical protein
MRFYEKYTEDQIEKVAKEIAELTDKNDHTYAARALAVFLKNKKAVKAYEGLDALNEYFGHSPQELIKLRSTITDSMLKDLKSKVSDEEYKKIYSSF